MTTKQKPGPKRPGKSTMAEPPAKKVGGKLSYKEALMARMEADGAGRRRGRPRRADQTLDHFPDLVSQVYIAIEVAGDKRGARAAAIKSVAKCHKLGMRERAALSRAVSRHKQAGIATMKAYRMMLELQELRNRMAYMPYDVCERIAPLPALRVLRLLRDMESDDIPMSEFYAFVRSRDFLSLITPK